MIYFATIFLILYDFTFSFHTDSSILYFSAGAREVIFISCVPIFTPFLSNNSTVITILVNAPSGSLKNYLKKTINKLLGPLTLPKKSLKGFSERA